MSKARSADALPTKFTANERYAWKWLHDCQIRGWLVDLLTKEVHWLDKYDRDHRFNSLVSFAEFFGMVRHQPPTVPRRTDSKE